VAGEQVNLDLTYWTMAQCLAAEDWIDTPQGRVPVTELRVGMLVWTLNGTRRKTAEPVLLVRHHVAPPGHYVLRIALDDGRAVLASLGHPTANGGHLGDLRVGDTLDGSRVDSIYEVPYVGDTWDLLPAGASGAYWADGVLLGSTLSG